MHYHGAKKLRKCTPRVQISVIMCLIPNIHQPSYQLIPQCRLVFDVLENCRNKRVALKSSPYLFEILKAFFGIAICSKTGHGT